MLDNVHEHLPFIFLLMSYVVLIVINMSLAMFAIVAKTYIYFY
jgi:hypothetical protein